MAKWKNFWGLGGWIHERNCKYTDYIVCVLGLYIQIQSSQASLDLLDLFSCSISSNMRQDNAMFWVDASSHPAIWPSPPPIHCMRPTYNVYIYVCIYINISYTRLQTMHIQAFLWYTRVYTFRRWNLLHAFKSNNPQTLRCTCRGPKTSRSNLAPSTVTSLQSIFFWPNSLNARKTHSTSKLCWTNCRVEDTGY